MDTQNTEHRPQPVEQKNNETKPERTPAFRSEALEAIEELLTVIESATMNVRSPAEAEALRNELPVINKNMSDLKRALKTSEANKAVTPLGKKIDKAFKKLISVAAKHDVNEEDAKQINSATRNYLTKLNSRIEEASSEKKEHFSFK